MLNFYEVMELQNFDLKLKYKVPKSHLNTW